jgi:hypothetical protein
MVERCDRSSLLRGEASVVAANKTWLKTLDNFMTDVNCLRSGTINGEILDNVEKWCLDTARTIRRGSFYLLYSK